MLVDKSNVAKIFMRVEDRHMPITHTHTLSLSHTLNTPHTSNTLTPRFIDPTLQIDVYADKPWALAPAVATMNHLSIRPGAGAEEAAAVAADLAATPGPVHTISEDALAAVPPAVLGGAVLQDDKKRDVSTRRKFFGTKERRAFELVDEVGMEFSNGVLGEYSY